MESSSRPKADVDGVAPRLTTADLIERRKAPLMPDTGVGGGGRLAERVYILKVHLYAM